MKPVKESKKYRAGSKLQTETSKAKEEEFSFLPPKTKIGTTKKKSTKTESGVEIPSNKGDIRESGDRRRVKSSKCGAKLSQPQDESVKDSARVRKRARLTKKGKTASRAEEEQLAEKLVQTKGQEEQVSVKRATKRKAAVPSDNEVRKRKVSKKKTSETELETEKKGEAVPVERSGDSDGSKKKVRKLKETKETVDVKTECGTRPKRRKTLDVEAAGDREKKQKLSPRPKTRAKKVVEKLPTKKAGTERGGVGKGGAKQGVAKERAVEEVAVGKEAVNGDTEDKAVSEMAREVVSKATKFVGAHMSISGGLDNAVKGAVATGSRAFALFLRSQRQWNAKPLEEEPAEKFRQACREHNFLPHLILPHGSYLLNCGSPNEETLRKSRETLADELNRCEKLGLTRYNFHPGSTCGQMTVEECLDKIGETINIVHQQTNKVMTVIENMSRQGSTIGGRFEELGGIIERVKDKTRIGVCLDTCHAFAAGFDLSTEAGYQQMMEDFDQIVGLKYLVAVHLNDSKGKVGSHLDRHEKIGQGQIGLKAFQRLMNDPRFDNIPLILETPVEDGMDYAKEIKLLHSLVGKS
ncbi:DNA-(apurinic or apyrimidinic site) lyase-like [Acanthaster planci]|uniref:DNA-(Apurinic or apyrimidinic site) lyase-like n=1 Tax=Acanthaster planci TaxID=133434 RepID=A0A8B7YJS6_ACAPL|nr:DNA-(apurinic or apyrimidinic site) lyase-like [Acanthaster planci]